MNIPLEIYYRSISSLELYTLPNKNMKRNFESMSTLQNMNRNCKLYMNTLPNTSRNFELVTISTMPNLLETPLDPHQNNSKMELNMHPKMTRN